MDLLPLVEEVRFCMIDRVANHACNHHERLLHALSALHLGLASRVHDLLKPIKLEVIFRQVVHAITTVRSWCASGTREAALHASLCCWDATLDCFLEPHQTNPIHILCSRLMWPLVARAFSELLLLALPASRLSSALRAFCIRAVRGLCKLPGLGTTLGMFLPGVASRLGMLATGLEKQHAQLRVEIIAAIQALLLATMADDHPALGASATRFSSPVLWVQALRDQASALHPGRRGFTGPANVGHEKRAHPSKWLSAATANLSPLLGRVCAVTSTSPSWRVRRQLVWLLGSLLLRCVRSLRQCMPTLLEALLATTHDSYPRVARPARATLALVGQRLPASAQLHAMVTESFDKQFATLPTLVLGLDEFGKERVMLAMCTELKLMFLAGGLHRLLLSRLGSLMASLLSCLSIAPRGSLIELRPLRTSKEIATRGDGACVLGAISAVAIMRYTRYSAPPLIHLSSTTSVSAATKLCETLGQLGGLPTLAHQLVQAATTLEGCGTTPSCVPALWLLNYVLLGACRRWQWRNGSVEEEDRGGNEPPLGPRTAQEQKKACRAGGMRAVPPTSALNMNAARPCVGLKSGSLVSSAATVMEQTVVADDECVLMLLGQLLEPGVWNEPLLPPSAAFGSLGQQQALLLQQEILLDVVGSAITLLAHIMLARTKGWPTASWCARSTVATHVLLGVTACGCDGKDVQLALRLSLFPLLERLGDASLVISSAAELTLCRLCVAVDALSVRRGSAPCATAGAAVVSVARSVSELLVSNSDFLLDSIGIRLRRVTWYPYTARVVQAVLEFGGDKVIPLAGDVLDDLLRFVDDELPRGDTLSGSAAVWAVDRLVPWLRALHLLVITCDKYLRLHSPQRLHRVDNDCGDCCCRQRLPSFFGTLLTELYHPEGVTLEEVSVMGSVAGSEPTAGAPDSAGSANPAYTEAEARCSTHDEALATMLPMAGTFALSALQKVGVLLLGGSALATHQLLNILEDVLPALTPWPCALLPALHLVWTPLLQLAIGDNCSVAAHATTAVTTAAHLFGAKLSSRAALDSVSKLRGALERHGAPVLAPLASTHPLAFPAAAYSARAAPVVVVPANRSLPSSPLPCCRAVVGSEGLVAAGRSQLVVLAATQALTALCVSRLSMLPCVLAILCVSTPLLSCRQPERVQVKARALVRRLATLDADMVWLFCVRMLPNSRRTVCQGTLGPACCVRPTEFGANARWVI